MFLGGISNVQNSQEVNNPAITCCAVPEIEKNDYNVLKN